MGWDGSTRRICGGCLRRRGWTHIRTPPHPHPHPPGACRNARGESSGVSSVRGDRETPFATPRNPALVTKYEVVVEPVHAGVEQMLMYGIVMTRHAQEWKLTWPRDDCGPATGYWLQRRMSESATAEQYSKSGLTRFRWAGRNGNIQMKCGSGDIDHQVHAGPCGFVPPPTPPPCRWALTPSSPSHTPPRASQP